MSSKMALWHLRYLTCFSVYLTPWTKRRKKQDWEWETSKIISRLIIMFESQFTLSKTDKCFPLGSKVWGLFYVIHLHFRVAESAPVWPSLDTLVGDLPLCPTTTMNNLPTHGLPSTLCYFSMVTAGLLMWLLQETVKSLRKETMINPYSHNTKKSTVNVC